MTFIYSADKMTHSFEKSYKSYKEISEYAGKINENLKLLDYITIQNSLKPNVYYGPQSSLIYSIIMENLQFLQNHEYFKNCQKDFQRIETVKKRLIGYKSITDSFSQEVKYSYEDGMYAVLALTTTSNIIFKELEVLSDDIDKISTKRTSIILDSLKIKREIAFGVLLFVFFLMLYINKKVVLSILRQIENLKASIDSFFDFLAKKRTDIVHITSNSNDEIANIANSIDSNIYIAEELLSIERQKTCRIEEKVKMIKALNQELEDTQREIVYTMGGVAEKRSKETGQHVKRVAEYSYILAILYGLTEKEALLLKSASPMHDIGKIGIPDNILNKPARLTDEEFKIMKTHSELGYEMLKHSQKSVLKASSIVAYEHHEKWNGKGYPQGLKGEKIHIFGRITAIADVFDALGSERVYKKAWSIKSILKLFKEERGEHFDPTLVDLFLENIDEFLKVKNKIDSKPLDKDIEIFEKKQLIITPF
jgi:response regulator RpfG family c-di-GMP phosphodiesterase